MLTTGIQKYGKYWPKTCMERSLQTEATSLPNCLISLFDDGIQLVHGIKMNMKNRLMSFYDKMMLRKRCIIETINDLLKNKAQLVHSRHRLITNFLVNPVAVLGAYCFFENKPNALQGYYIEDSKQLSLF